jgi:hypothetical protein
MTKRKRDNVCLSLVHCIVCLSFGHCIVCLSSASRYPFYYLQIFLN